MTSYTEEEKRKAVEMVEECVGSVMHATSKSGYPSRLTLYQWLNEWDASHERKAGGPWSHCDPALRVQAVAFVHPGMTGGDFAEMLGVSSAAVACNRVGATENPSRAAADRSSLSLLCVFVYLSNVRYRKQYCRYCLWALRPTRASVPFRYSNSFRSYRPWPYSRLSNGSVCSCSLLCI